MKFHSFHTAPIGWPSAPVHVLLSHITNWFLLHILCLYHKDRAAGFSKTLDCVYHTTVVSSHSLYVYNYLSSKSERLLCSHVNPISKWNFKYCYHTGGLTTSARSGSNETEFDSGGNWILVVLATIQSRTLCLLVYRRKMEKLEYTNYNFACGSVSGIKGGTLTEDVWEHGAEEDIGT
jgi:hypothetical protein